MDAAGISNQNSAIRPAGLLTSPAHAAMLFAALQCFVWTLAPALSHNSPPLDVVEGYLWGQEWVVGTFKHPNMPGWVLETSRALTGQVGWPAYLASQLFVAATYLTVFMLGREMMDSRRALMGTLLLAGVFYFAWPTIEFNHNVAQMPFWSAIAWILWRLRMRPEIIWWVLLGFVGADSLYAKLSSSLMLMAAGAWILGDPALRRQLLRPGPWFGLLVFLIVGGPLLLWLVKSHFGPLLYAAERASGPGVGVLTFLGAQGLACLGLLALTVVTGLAGPIGASGAAGPPPPPRIAIAFLAVITLVPMVIAMLLAATSGIGLKSMWGTPMFDLAGLLTVAVASRRVTDRALLRLTIAVCVLLVVLPVGYAVDTRYESRFTGKPKRQNWPQVDIATRFDELWRANTGKPLRIVAGERWIAGLTALRPGPMPSILTDGDLRLSPWITADRLRNQGALVVWSMKAASDSPPEALAQLLDGHAKLTARFASPLFPDAQPILIGYAIVPPG